MHSFNVFIILSRLANSTLQLSGEVVDMNQETRVWDSVNRQEGAYGGPSSGQEILV
jgi:hypothetical protein